MKKILLSAFSIFLLLFTACQNKDAETQNIKHSEQIVIKQTQTATISQNENIQKIMAIIDEGTLIEGKVVHAGGAVPYYLEFQQEDGTVDTYIVYSDKFGKVISDNETIWYQSNLGEKLEELVSNND